MADAIEVPHHDNGKLDLEDVSSGGYIIRRTMPDEVLRHDISDEELDALCGSQRDHIAGGTWAAGGACLGALPAAINALLVYRTAQVLPITDLIQVLIAAVAAAIFFVLLLIVQGKTSSATEIKAKIRARTNKANV